MKTINVNGIAIDLTTYRLTDLYGLYVGDYNNIEELEQAINREVEIKQNKLIKEKIELSNKESYLRAYI